MSMYGFLDMFMNINNIDSRHLKVNWALTSDIDHRFENPAAVMGNGMIVRSSLTSINLNGPQLLYMYPCICICVYIIYMYVCMYVSMYVCMHVCMHVCICICIYCICICI